MTTEIKIYHVQPAPYPQSCGRECGCHPLQHLIWSVIARYEAPIPPPTHSQTIETLRDGLAQWEADQ